ncbi:hypothetical protein MTO96_024814 [Rhipicephalus appendiculatus]
MQSAAWFTFRPLDRPLEEGNGLKVGPTTAASFSCAAARPSGLLNHSSSVRPNSPYVDCHRARFLLCRVVSFLQATGKPGTVTSRPQECTSPQHSCAASSLGGIKSALVGRQHLQRGNARLRCCRGA